MKRTLLPVYIIVNGLFRGVLRISDEAQRVCTVECTAILVAFDLVYHLSSEYRNCRLSYRCTVINSTLNRNYLTPLSAKNPMTPLL